MANVLFRRGTQEYINNNVPISDGQVVFNETDQAIYVDTPVNNVITRLRYGGGNLSRSDIDSALSDTSENPVQNKVITESVLQKTDIVNDYNTAVAVTATDIPVGCGVIKTANTKIGDLQSALNTTNGTVAQHTTDIEALNTGLANNGNGVAITDYAVNNALFVADNIAIKRYGKRVVINAMLHTLAEVPALTRCVVMNIGRAYVPSSESGFVFTTDKLATTYNYLVVDEQGYVALKIYSAVAIPANSYCAIMAEYQLV